MLAVTDELCIVRKTSLIRPNSADGRPRRLAASTFREGNERAHALTHRARESGPFGVGYSAIRVCFNGGVSAKDDKRVKHRRARRVGLASG